MQIRPKYDHDDSKLNKTGVIARFHYMKKITNRMSDSITEHKIENQKISGVVKCYLCQGNFVHLATCNQ